MSDAQRRQVYGFWISHYGIHSLLSRHYGWKEAVAWLSGNQEVYQGEDTPLLSSRSTFHINETSVIVFWTLVVWVPQLAAPTSSIGVTLYSATHSSCSQETWLDPLHYSNVDGLVFHIKLQYSVLGLTYETYNDLREFTFKTILPDLRTNPRD